MRILLSVLVLFVAFGGVTAELNEENEGPPLFLQAIETGLPISPDGDYGRLETLAIKLGAPDSSDPTSDGRRNRTYYLLSLRGPNGEQVKYKRLGSCCAQPDPHGYKGRALLDVFEVTYDGLETPVELYFNVYSYDEPQIPSGFTSEYAARATWKELMWEN